MKSVFKSLKLLDISLLILLLIFISINNILPDKVYCYANIESDFSSEKVIVVLNKDASFLNKEYRVDDFNEINCTKLTDLTAEVTYNAIRHRNNDLLNIDNYKRILSIELTYPSKENVLTSINKLINNENVLYAGPSYNYIISATPYDEYCSNQWAINSINLPNAWNYSTGSRDVLVGILDTGIDMENPDLESTINTKLSKDFTSNSDSNISSITDAKGHGTHVAGIIGAYGNNGIGIAGVNWNVSLVSLKVANSEGKTDISNLAKAVSYAENNNIKILNFSSNISNINYNIADDYAYSTIIASYNGLFVNSAGNDGIDIDSSTTAYPARCSNSNMIVVGAYNSNNEKSSFSNYGDTSVDIYAPGENILSTYPIDYCKKYNIVFEDGTRLCEFGEKYINNFQNEIDNYAITWDYLKNNFESLTKHNPCDYITIKHQGDGYHYLSGTSMAAPFVSGVAALMLSVNPNLTSTELKNIILESGEEFKFTDSNGVEHTSKKLNAYRAMIKTHVHNYIKWEYYDNISHIEMCYCGEPGTKTSPHVVILSNDNRYARCIECNHKLDMRYDIGILSISQKIKCSVNGSYIRPDGIIVLVEEDIDAYYKGTLKFYYTNLVTS